VLETFDAVPGNIACVRRTRSNTPLQALTSLNEPLFMECARALAARALEEDCDSDRARIIFAMRRCVSRTPRADEIAVLERLLDKERQRIRKGELDAAAIVNDPEAKGEQLNERAAWTLVARVLLNLDETITKE
jgi:hypothetical protein